MTVLSGALEVLSWSNHLQALNRIRSQEEFFDYVESSRAAKFRTYQRDSRIKRLGFLSILNAIDVDPLGINFLDLGPGYGDTLDVCSELGARSMSFTEIDPFFYTFNRLKRFTTPYYLNHLLWLQHLPAGKFDFIWCKGSIVADHAIFSQRLPLPKWPFDNWIAHLERLAAPGAHIVLCPHWRNDGSHRRFEDVRTSVLTTFLLSCGYEVLPAIPGHNAEPAYPLTYHKNC